ncbi:MAG TPA: winged helix DNA-binding domain-containing protein [Actinomycetota bacterium]|nr:winged helix DNA-binding domain-containing protein [Actinomycetota bacterium]
MRALGAAERRARVGVRHALAERVASVEDAAASVVALHSSDPVAVFLSAWARVEGFEPDDLEDALYVRKSLVRMLGMRRTLFVVPRDLAPVMHEACTKALIPRERARLVRMLEEQGIAKRGSGERWLGRVEEKTLSALKAGGQASARELTAEVPELANKLSFGEGKSWGGTFGVSTRVLFLLATEGQIVRTRPLGTWTSGQYRWSTVERWLGRPLPAVDHDEACAELLRRWLERFGPATATDIRWWTGWTARLTASTLSAVGAVEVGLGDGRGWVLPDDVEAVAAPEPWVAFLPGLDPTVMGWKERAWYLGRHEADLFDRNGNGGPTVWADGRVVGAWGQTEAGEIRIKLHARVDADTRSRIGAERERLRAWFGDVRIRTRFGTELERVLTGR